jgi:hypothetical protein
MAELLGETTVTRSWQWGAAVLGDPAAPPPAPTAALVTLGTSALVLRLHHAQDVELVDGEPSLATATCHVRVLSEAEPTTRTVLCDVVLETASGKLSLGDGAGAVVIEVEGSPRHRVVVSAEHLRTEGLDEVWVDVIRVAQLPLTVL